MTIKEAIELLNTYENKDEEIIIAWWDRDEFLDKEEFENALENQDNVEWSGVHDQLRGMN